MGAGDNFTLTPNVVIPVEPKYNNIITPSESMKKEYLNMSATPLEQWKLVFNVLTSTQMNTLLTHFKDNSGGYYAFTWTTVPSYVNSGANLTGHWVPGSLSFATAGNKYWQINITFEKSN